jgi:thiosulfate dehydrogenase (quinone) large subunit
MFKGSRVPLWPLAVARIYVGLVFIVAGVRQLGGTAPWVTPGETWSAAVHQQLTTWAPHTAGWYAGILTHVLLPHSDVIAPLVAWAHVVLGVALVLGLSTRLAAGLAVLVLLNYAAAAGSKVYGPGPTAVLTALALTVSLADAGRVWGLDARRRTSAAESTMSGWVVLPLRLYFGAAFLSAASNKVGAANWSQWPGWMAGVITDRMPHVTPWYQPVLTGMILPHVAFFAPLVAVTEIVVGVALLAGLGTRIAAGIGILLTLNYFLLDGLSAVDVSNDAAFVVGLTVLILTAGGPGLTDVTYRLLSPSNA